MHSRLLDELPPPPAGRVGWPWTTSSAASSAQSKKEAWPRLTLITPSYNQGKFIEETIRSVLLQGYPNLEYLVIDGGSTDDSVKIIRKYEPWLTYWTSEPDRGQAHAINKGLDRAAGTLWGWINSDDLLCPDVLAPITQLHRDFPDCLIAGDVVEFWEGEGRQQLVRQSNIELRNFVEFWNHEGHWHQPGIFFPMHLTRKVGALDETLRYLFDYDLLCRILKFADVRYLDRPVAYFRLHSGSKTVSEGDLFLFELCRISKRYWPTITPVDLAGYRQRVSGLFFCTGCQRFVHRQRRAFRLMAEGLKIHPFWAVISALRLLPSWPQRRRARHFDAPAKSIDTT